MKISDLTETKNIYGSKYNDPEDYVNIPSKTLLADHAKIKNSGKKKHSNQDVSDMVDIEEELMSRGYKIEDGKITAPATEKRYDVKTKKYV